MPKYQYLICSICGGGSEIGTLQISGGTLATISSIRHVYLRVCETRLSLEKEDLEKWTLPK